MVIAVWVCPAERDKTYWWILPLRTDLPGVIDFAQHLGGENIRIIMTSDRCVATTDKGKVPDHIHLLMPPPSPEPAWQRCCELLTNEPIANQSLRRLDQLEEVLFNTAEFRLGSADLIPWTDLCYYWAEGSLTTCY